MTPAICSVPSGSVPPDTAPLLRLVYEHCGITWDDVWDCACNDRCPLCGKEIEPLSWSDVTEAA